MKLNLKNARRLENAIQQVIVELSDSMSDGCYVSIYDDRNVEDIISLFTNENGLKHDALTQLIELRYDIRAKIGQVNEQSGLNAYMCSDRALNDKIHYLATTLQSMKKVTADDVLTLTNMIQAKREGKIESYGSRGDKVHIGIPASEEMLAETKLKIANMKKMRAEIADECSKINLTKTIELSDEQVKLATEQGLL